MEIPKELRQRYLERRVKDVDDCFEALQNKDRILLERVGHQLKGNALTFGYADLADIGQKMEASARAEDWGQLENLALEFKDFLKNLPSNH